MAPRKEFSKRRCATSSSPWPLQIPKNTQEIYISEGATQNSPSLPNNFPSKNKIIPANGERHNKEKGTYKTGKIAKTLEVTFKANHYTHLFPIQCRGSYTMLNYKGTLSPMECATIKGDYQEGTVK